MLYILTLFCLKVKSLYRITFPFLLKKSQNQKAMAGKYLYLGGSLKGLGIKEQADIDWMTPRIGPQPLKTFTQPLHLSTPLDTSLKKTYIQLTDDRPHFNDSLDRARRQGFQIYSLLSGGHDAMVTQPAALAKIFNALA